MRLLFLLLFIFFVFSNLTAQEIALTFDDAPMEDGPFYTGEERANIIIKHLKNSQVPQAAFFVITRNIETNAGLNRLQRYVQAGHVLANHTHRHRWMHEIGTQRYIEDIKTADDRLKKIDGYVPWFRYPFLDEGRTKSARDSVRLALQSMGLKNGYVTVDNYDWYINGQVRKAKQEGKVIDESKLRELYLEHIWNSIKFYDDVAIKILGRSPKHVLLLHENDMTAKYLGDLIQLIQQRGWKIISPLEAYKDPIADQVPDVLFNGQGRVAAIAREQGAQARTLVQEAEDEAYLDNLVSQRQIFK